MVLRTSVFSLKGTSMAILLGYPKQLHPEIHTGHPTPRRDSKGFILVLDEREGWQIVLDLVLHCMMWQSPARAACAQLYPKLIRVSWLLSSGPINAWGISGGNGLQFDGSECVRAKLRSKTANPRPGFQRNPRIPVLKASLKQLLRRLYNSCTTLLLALERGEGIKPTSPGAGGRTRCWNWIRVSNLKRVKTDAYVA